eukprot:gene11825-15825_t
MMQQSADQLWLAVMNCNLSNESISESDKKKWRPPNSKYPGTCEYCQESSQGVLIRCNNEKCVKEYHIDCAFQLGGLSLDNSGILTFKCENHFTNVTFCICNEKYDSSRDMVCCDECIEWFHNSCVGLDTNEALQLDKYVCNSCTATIKANKQVPKAMKDKNKEKDYRSYCNQSALKAVEYLVDIVNSICTVIDAISAGNEGIISVADDIEPAKAYLGRIKDYRNKMLEQKFEEDSNEDPKDFDADTEFVETMNQLGVAALLESWHDQLQYYVTNYNEWLGRADVEYQQTLVQLKPIFNEIQVTIAAECCKRTDLLKNELVHSLRSVPLELEGFYTFCNVLAWIYDFLQTLHHGIKSEQWHQKLSNAIRMGGSLTKSLHAQSKTRRFCQECLIFFQEYHKLAHQTAANLNSWYIQTDKILNQNSLYNLSDLVTYMHSAERFPTVPLLYKELSNIIDEAKVLEQSVQSVLSQTEASEELVQKLSEERNSLSVLLTSDEALTIVINQFAYIKFYESTMSNERITLAIAESLKAQGSAAVTINETSTTILSTSLKEKIETLLLSLQVYFDELVSFTCTINPEVLLGNIKGSAILEKIKLLKIISPEEELLDFLETTDIIQTQINDVLSSTESSISIVDAESIIDQLESGLANKIIEQFAVANNRKIVLKKLLSSFLDIETRASKLWTIVSSHIREATIGHSLCIEDFIEPFQSAKNTRIIDQEIQNQADLLIQKAEIISLDCSAGLTNVHFTIDDIKNRSIALDKIEEYQLLVLHNPVSKSLREMILAKSKLVHTVCKCWDILNPVDVTNQEQYSLSHIRELILNLDELAKTELDSTELILLNTVKDPFHSYHWRCEVRSIISNKNASLSVAEKLLEDSQYFSDQISQTDEWIQLKNHVNSSKEHLLSSNNALNQLLSIKEKLVHSNNPDNIDNNDNNLLESNLFPIDLTNHLKLWIELSVGIEEIFSSLLFQGEKELTIVDVVLMDQIREAHSFVSLINQAAIVILKMSERLSNQENDMTNTLSTEYLFSLKQNCVIDFRDLTSLTNRFSCLTEKETQSIAFITQLAGHFSLIHSMASSWNEFISSLLPQKTTRNKTKNELKTIIEIKTALMKPIARIVIMPMHDKIISTIQDIEMIRLELLNFLFGNNESSENINNNNQENIINDTIFHCDYNDDFDAALFDQILQLTTIQTKAEMIPLDIMETKVISWVIAVFTWIQSVPHPGYNPKDNFISLDFAKKKINEADLLIKQLPLALSETLILLNILNSHSPLHSTAFNIKTIPNLKYCGELYNYIEFQIQNTIIIQQKMNDFIMNGTSKTLIIYTQINNEISELIVQPDLSIRRLFEKKYHDLQINKDEPTKIKDESNKNKRIFSITDTNVDNNNNNNNNNNLTKLKKSNNDVYAVDHYIPRESKVVAKSFINAVTSGLAGPGPGPGPSTEDKKPKIIIKCGNPTCTTNKNKSKNSFYCCEQCVYTALPLLFKELKLYKEKGGILSELNGGVATTTGSLWSHNLVTRTSSNEDKKLSTVHHLISTLPSAVASNVYLHEEMPPNVVNSSVAVKPASSAAPAGIQRTSSSGSTGAASTTKSVNTTATSDKEMRFKVRLSLEDCIMNSLFRLNRLSVSAVISMTASFVIDLEDELYEKYTTYNNAKDTDEFDKKEYRKHYQMLIWNLKQAHNDRLVRRLVTYEETVETLLGMTSQQFADAATKTIREKHNVESLMESHRRTSMEETLEAKRREAMQGSESWRSADGQRLAVNTVSIGASSDITSIADDDNQLSMIIDNESKIDDNPNAPESPNGIKRTTSNEDTNGNKSVKPKRPLDVDASTRMVSNKPFKSPRIEVPTDEIMNDSSVTSPKSPANNKSPKPVKAPNLLELIKSNNGPSQQESSKSTYESAVAAASSASHSRITPLSLTKWKLVNNDGNDKFKIIRPGFLPIECNGIVYDRRVQGLITESINIEGRTKIEDLEKFISEVIALGRKITAMFRLELIESNQPSGYAKFCDEFTRDNRA